MSERRGVVKAVAKEYRKASKKEKGAILDRFVEATDYQRRYGPDCHGIKQRSARLWVGTRGERSSLKWSWWLTSGGRARGNYAR